ncbi:MAG: hypothetical protein ACE5EY_02120, partial [Anaerolineae bacterium]
CLSSIAAGDLAATGLKCTPRLPPINDGDRAAAVSAAADSDQTTWMSLPPLDSYTSPALIGHSDSRVYAAAVAFSGLVAFTATDLPGNWAAWQIIGPTPPTCSRSGFLRRRQHAANPGA